MKWFVSLSVLLAMVFGFTVSSLNAQLPESKQATLIEAVSSSELLLEATGIYISSEKKAGKAEKDIDKNGIARATDDAKKACLYFVLFGGTDPMITTTGERQKFDTQMGFFFNMDTISRYISYEDVQLMKKVSINDGFGIKIVKRFKINKEIVRKDLENYNIMDKRQEVANILGNPVLMVLPATEKGQNPVDLLRSNPKVQQAAGVIESHLTAKKYEVLSPEQTAALNTLSDAQSTVGNREEDIAYKLALSIGSDVYLTFSGTSEDQGYGTQRYAMVVKAFETTTGRLLGTETGYSQARKGDTMISIEEAVNSAVNNVLARIDSYWKDDLANGVQYKVIVSMSTSFDEDQVEDITFAFKDAMKTMTKKNKANVATNQTLDYIIWCDPAKFGDSTEVYRGIKEAFKKKGLDSGVKRITVNRKLVQLKIDPK